VRRLFPAGDPSPVDLDAAYGEAATRWPVPDRPWVLANMVSSIDGATAVTGVSGPLGGTADRAVFAAVRTVPDVIVVGAGTVRAERYGPPRSTDERRRRRAARGQHPVPRMAIVSAGLDLDVATPLFTEAEQRPLLLTTAAADPAAVARAEEVADVAVAGDDLVTAAGALAELWARGARTVLCEGGPTLLGVFVAAGLLDELCLTYAPLLAAGASARIAAGPSPAAPIGMLLAHVLEEDGTLFLRYVRPA
jgi:riboflavin biosynthesis pyrimidine reductase